MSRPTVPSTTVPAPPASPPSARRRAPRPADRPLRRAGRPLRPAGRLVVATAVTAATAVVAVPGPALAAGPDRVVLDATQPTAIAAAGTTAAWLRPTTSGGTRTQLVVRDGPGAAPRVVEQALPANARQLTLGTDADGTPTAIVTARSEHPYGPVPHPRRHGYATALYALPLDGSAAPRRLAVSPAGSDVQAAGLSHGRLTFARHERLREGMRWTVRIGSLTSGRSTIASRTDEDVVVSGTTPVADGRVAYATVRLESSSGGGQAELRLLKPGSRSVRLSQSTFGGASDCGFGPLTVSPDGRRLSASRWTIAGAHPHDFSTWSVPAGRLLRTAKSRAGGELAVPVGAEGTIVADGEYARPNEGVVLLPTAG